LGLANQRSDGLLPRGFSDVLPCRAQGRNFIFWVSNRYHRAGTVEPANQPFFEGGATAQWTEEPPPNSEPQVVVSEGPKKNDRAASIQPSHLFGQWSGATSHLSES
jgi:hypothetical protein